MRAAMPVFIRLLLFISRFEEYVMREMRETAKV